MLDEAVAGSRRRPARRRSNACSQIVSGQSSPSKACSAMKTDQHEVQLDAGRRWRIQMPAAPAADEDQRLPPDDEGDHRHDAAARIASASSRGESSARRRRSRSQSSCRRSRSSCAWVSSRLRRDRIGVRRDRVVAATEFLQHLAASPVGGADRDA